MARAGHLEAEGDERSGQVNEAAAWAMLRHLMLVMGLIVATLLFMLWWGTRRPR